MKTLLVASTLALTTATALAGGDGDLWVGAVSIVCVEQDPALGKTPLGHHLVDAPEYKAWRTGPGAPLAACVARRDTPMVPRALCLELFKLPPDVAPSGLSSLYDKYAADIQGLSDKLDACAP